MVRFWSGASPFESPDVCFPDLAGRFLARPIQCRCQPAESAPDYQSPS
jgi:hypothetical protein